MSPLLLLLLSQAPSIVTTTGYDNTTGTLVRNLKEETTRTGITVDGNYTEHKVTTGQDGDMALDSYTDTIRTNTVMDGFGRALSYTEESWQNGKPGSYTKTDTFGLFYNVDGDIINSQSRSVNFQGAPRTWSGREWSTTPSTA